MHIIPPTKLLYEYILQENDNTFSVTLILFIRCLMVTQSRKTYVFSNAIEANLMVWSGEKNVLVSYPYLFLRNDDQTTSTC